MQLYYYFSGLLLKILAISNIATVIVIILIAKWILQQLRFYKRLIKRCNTGRRGMIKLAVNCWSNKFHKNEQSRGAHKTHLNKHGGALSKNSYRPLLVFEKSSFLDIWLGSEYTPEKLTKHNCKVKQTIYDMINFISSSWEPFTMSRITAYNIVLTFLIKISIINLWNWRFK